MVVTDKILRIIELLILLLIIIVIVRIIYIYIDYNQPASND